MYKGGHHGSHNATPRSVVEGLPTHLTMLVPTQNTPFPIPEPKLMAALGERSGHRVVRSDDEGPAARRLRKGDRSGSITGWRLHDTR